MTRKEAIEAVNQTVDSVCAGLERFGNPGEGEKTKEILKREMAGVVNRVFDGFEEA